MAKLSFSTLATSALSNQLTAGFVISSLVHATVLAIHIALPAPPPGRFRDLEVVLVNARHDKAPTDAKLLAQHNLDGGGSTDQNVYASAPVPMRENTSDGDGLVDMHRAERTSVQPTPEHQGVMTQQKSSVSIANNTTPVPDRPPSQDNVPTGDDPLNSVAMRQQILLAAISKSTETLNQWPRRIQAGARTLEYRFAFYVDSWRTKVEEIGTNNYPEAARGKIYGSLLMAVSIKKDGSVEKVVIYRSSGQKVLDDAAQKIVRLGAPYAAFPPDVAKDVDVIDIVRTWTFTRENTLSTTGAER